MVGTRRLAVAAVFAIVIVSTAGPSEGSPRDPRIEHLELLYAGSQPDSPARFRIIEERDRLLLGDGETATLAGEIAQFRAAEDL